MLKEDQKEKLPTGVKAAFYALAGLVGLIVFLIVNPFVIVPAGQKALVFNWGAVSDNVLDQGLHFRVPIMQKVEKVTIQPIQLDYSVPVSEDGAITQDNQTVGSDTTIFYSYQPDNLVAMWRDYGERNIRNLVQSAVKESFKEVIGDYTIFDIAKSQEDVRTKVKDAVVAKLAMYPITVNELRVQNYDWSDEFDRQIEATMNRAQEVRRAEQELLITEQQANKQVKEAEAAKQAAITKAEGERDAAALMAEAKALEGEGIRKYNESIAATRDIEIKLRELDIEKTRAALWDGKMVPSQVFTPIPLDLRGNFQTP